jgi:hypothetical protein
MSCPSCTLKIEICRLCAKLFGSIFYLINIGIINGPCARFRDNRILLAFFIGLAALP